MNSTSSNRKNMNRRRLLLLLTLSAAGLTTAGCYTRTVEAKGVGAEFGKTNIYEPNMKMNHQEGDTMFDGAGDLLLGPRRIEERR